MSDDVDLQQAILRRTLQEVGAHHEPPCDAEVANPCVICLEPVSEPAIAVPCRHANFDFLCLLSWLEQRRTCPLCKSDITSVKYDLDNSSDGFKIYQLPEQQPTDTDTSHAPSRARNPPRSNGPPRRHSRNYPTPRPAPSDPLRRRQEVYRRQLYSLRVGSNRLSQYQELTPSRFNNEEALVSRARKWIRRELQVFSFLHPEPSPPPPEPSRQGNSAQRVPRAGQQRLDNRRGNNAEFLLEYIVAILRTVDIKGSAGQAEELLRDFLGRENARLFLHELQAWLRSPYMTLEDWDRHVQYEDTVGGSGAGPSRGESSTPVYLGRGGGRGGRGRGGPSRGGVAKRPYRGRNFHRGSSRDDAAQARRLQSARDRYVPD